jgi:hypothetical protein
VALTINIDAVCCARWGRSKAEIGMSGMVVTANRRGVGVSRAIQCPQASLCYSKERWNQGDFGPG